MPTDLKLDLLTHDIDLTNGGVMIEDNGRAVGQRVKIAILLKRGEWFRDVSYGVPYQQEFFQKKNNKTFIDQFMVSYINEIEEVTKIVQYNSEINPITRVLDINVTIETYAGDIVGINTGDTN